MPFDGGSIMSVIGLDANPFTQGFAQVNALTSIFPSIVTNFMANPLLGLVDLTKSVFNGIVTAARAAFDFIKSAFNTSFENADKLADLAQNTGVAVETLSGLGLVAAQAGSGVDEIAEAFKFLGKNVSDAMGGSKEAIESFAKTGVEFSDLAGNVRPLGDVFFDLTNAMQQMVDPGDKTAASMSLLGRSGAGLIGTLSQGSEALREQADRYKSWGATISQTSVASADTFDAMQNDMTNAFAAIQNAIGEPLREALTPTFKQIMAWLTQHMPTISKITRETFTQVGEIVAKVSGQIGANFPLIAQIAGAASNGILQAIRIVGSGFLMMVEGYQRGVGMILQTVASAAGMAKGIPLIGWMFGDVGSLAANAAQFAKIQADALNSVRNSFNETVTALQNGIQRVATDAAVNTGGNAGKSSGSGASGGSTSSIQPVTVNVTGIDPEKSAAEVAKQLIPAMQEAQRKQQAAIGARFKQQDMIMGGF